MSKLLFYCSFVFLQAGLFKACANADKAFLKEGAAIEKNLAAESKSLSTIYKMTESEIKVMKPATESLTIVEKSKQLAPEFAAVKKDRSEKIKNVVDKVDIPGPEDPSDKMNNNLFGNSTEVYVKDIISSNYFFPLCKMVRYRFKNENLNEEQVTELLKGNKVDTMQFKPTSLFNIYYMFSKNFSEKVLIQIAEKTNCDKIKIAEIKQIAESKGIPSTSTLYSVLNKCK
jgi:hypothetical protein